MAINQHCKCYRNLCRLNVRGGGSGGNHAAIPELQLLDSNAADGLAGCDPVPTLVLSGVVASPSVGTAPVFGTVTEGGSSSGAVTLSNAPKAGVLLINTVTATGDFSVGGNGCAASLAAGSPAASRLTSRQPPKEHAQAHWSSPIGRRAVLKR